jgi:hypothetical protein
MNSASVFAPNAYSSILYDIIQVYTADAVHLYLSNEVLIVLRKKLYKTGFYHQSSWIVYSIKMLFFVHPFKKINIVSVRFDNQQS